LWPTPRGRSTTIARAHASYLKPVSMIRARRPVERAGLPVGELARADVLKQVQGVEFVRFRRAEVVCVMALRANLPVNDGRHGALRRMGSRKWCSRRAGRDRKGEPRAGVTHPRPPACARSSAQITGRLILSAPGCRVKRLRSRPPRHRRPAGDKKQGVGAPYSRPPCSGEIACPSG
jgi:hypothetical protein